MFLKTLKEKEKIKNLFKMTKKNHVGWMGYRCGWFTRLRCDVLVFQPQGDLIATAEDVCSAVLNGRLGGRRYRRNTQASYTTPAWYRFVFSRGKSGAIGRGKKRVKIRRRERKRKPKEKMLCKASWCNYWRIDLSIDLSGPPVQLLYTAEGLLLSVPSI